MNVDVATGADTVSAILNSLASSLPAGGTPTSVALMRAYDFFTAGAGAYIAGDRYVLLATDGGPNCNPSTACTSRVAA